MALFSLYFCDFNSRFPWTFCTTDRSTIHSDTLTVYFISPTLHAEFLNVRQSTPTVFSIAPTVGFGKRTVPSLALNVYFSKCTVASAALTVHFGTTIFHYNKSTVLFSKLVRHNCTRQHFLLCKFNVVHLYINTVITLLLNRSARPNTPMSQLHSFHPKPHILL